jgi:hypothetical protein
MGMNAPVPVQHSVSAEPGVESSLMIICHVISIVETKVQAISDAADGIARQTVLRPQWTWMAMNGLQGSRRVL